MLKCKNGWFNPISIEMEQVPYSDILKLVLDIDTILNNPQECLV